MARKSLRGTKAEDNVGRRLTRSSDPKAALKPSPSICKKKTRQESGKGLKKKSSKKVAPSQSKEECRTSDPENSDFQTKISGRARKTCDSDQCESTIPSRAKKRELLTHSSRFIGKPLSRAEAFSRWPKRFSSSCNEVDVKLNSTPRRSKNNTSEHSNEKKSVLHYLTAEVDGVVYSLGDCVQVNGEGGDKYLATILEFFEKADESQWFQCQWFYRVEDTGIGKGLDEFVNHDPKRVFYSSQVDDNPLDCIIEKKSIVRVAPASRMGYRKNPIPRCDNFYDMGYDVAYSTVYVLPEDASSDGSENLSTIETSEETSVKRGSAKKVSRTDGTKCPSKDVQRDAPPEFTLLDLYSGCGAMSTGLCNGCSLADANLVTRWAVDLNQYACQSLKFNHPEAEVRNESAEDFLSLIKAWHQLCEKYGTKAEELSSEEKAEELSGADEDDECSDNEVYEVESIVGIRWAGSSKLEMKLENGKSPRYVESEGPHDKPGLEFKVQWKGYANTNDDTWEPEKNLNCPNKIRDFVISGQERKILPLPGQCDVICGGPPCQGASGFNRFRNTAEPLKCVRNKQIIVYMDIVEFLRPRFVLMENVVDILKFADGILGKYALSRLVKLNYQAKLGILAAGRYGLPQFRMRVFLWGAAPEENLPAYPLPTHEVVLRGHPPQNWEKNVVQFDETESPDLEKALFLKDAISDLPKIANHDARDEMAYDKRPQSSFQKLIRAPQHVLNRQPSEPKSPKPRLYDHRPLELNADDYERVQRVPHRKGANFRDLEGVVVREDGTVERKKTVLLRSGKPLVPDYAISFVKGKSLKPFARLWWDEIVATVVTRAEPHNLAILHPEQDRVLSIRENARLQGFPDWYKLFGSVKERYMQVGNAVAVPVARALGFALGRSIKLERRERIVPLGKAAVLVLPSEFPSCLLDLER